MYINKIIKKLNGFTLIELLIVIAIIAIVTAVVFVALNPLARFRESRNAQRWKEVTAVADAVRLYQVSNNGQTPSGLDSSWRMLGTDSSGCDVSCGTGSSVSFVDDIQTEFDSGTYSSTQWDGTNTWVELTTGASTGNYISSIKDSGSASTIWTSLAWTPQRPSYKELPNSMGVESVYGSGNVNMTGNILLFHFNDGVGVTSFSDSSGNSNNGSCSGDACPTYSSSGKLNGGFVFDSVDDYIDISPSNPATAVAVTAWFKSLGAPKGGYHIIVGPADVEISIPSSGQIRTGVTTNIMGRQVYNSGSGLTNGNWHQVAMTYDGTYLRSFIDGVQTNQQNVTGNLTGMCTRIGRYGSSDLYYTNGIIDELAIYNRTLTPTEIADIYKRGAIRLKYRVRSCDDSSCSGEMWQGPDGTASTYYTELSNSTLGLPSLSLTNLSANRYFQYQANFETDKTAYTPEINDVTANYNTGGNGQALQSSCLDLSSILSNQLRVIPKDPSDGSTAKTYYAIRRQSSGQIDAKACSAEGGEIISVTK
ncbi:MAG: LamG domain-containing protein [bacterium]